MPSTPRLRRLVAVLAAVLATTALALAPALAQADDPETLRRQAQSALNAGKTKRALKLLKRAIEGQAQVAPFEHFNLFQVAEAAGRCDDAVFHGALFAQASPDDPEARRVRKRIDRCTAKGSRAATLTVSCDVKGAVAFVDGISVGPADGREVTLMAGKVQVAVEAPDHHRFEQAIALKKKATEALTATLKPRVYEGTLTVTTDPPGATVLIAGQAAGKTPLEGHRLTVGKHFVELSLAGHDAFIRNVKIERDQASELHAVLEKAASAVPAPAAPKTAAPATE